MNKEFIPYEQALILKELGFDEPCLAFYNHQGKLIMMSQENEEEISIWKNSYVLLGKQYAAPTFSQAFRWFREKYNIHAEITWSPSYEYDPGEWSDAIYEITFVDVSYTKEWKAESPDMQRGNGKQLTFEEAELACLKRLIEIVKNK